MLSSQFSVVSIALCTSKSPGAIGDPSSNRTRSFPGSGGVSKQRFPRQRVHPVLVAVDAFDRYSRLLCAFAARGPCL
jgi:hypothetical protein